MTSIFEGTQPPKTRPKLQSKQGSFGIYIYIYNISGRRANFLPAGRRARGVFSRPRAAARAVPQVEEVRSTSTENHEFWGPLKGSEFWKGKWDPENFTGNIGEIW